MQRVLVVGPAHSKFKQATAESITQHLAAHKITALPVCADDGSEYSAHYKNANDVVVAYTAAYATSLNSGPAAYAALQTAKPRIIVMCVNPIADADPIRIGEMFSEEIALTLRLAHIFDMRTCIGAIAVDLTNVLPTLYDTVLAKYANYGFVVFDGKTECLHLTRLIVNNDQR